MQSEAQIEKTFIDILTERDNQWTYRGDIKTEKALWDNVRNHINRINVAELDGILLSDNEFAQVQNEFKRHTATPFLASQWLRGENGIAKLTVERDDTTKKPIPLTLFSNKDIAGGISSYEVVNQIAPNTDEKQKSLRGDVTLLINGLPVIHIELKNEYAKDGYMQAFYQLERYAKSGFFDGLYATVQIFVISNNAFTKYFARPGSNDNFNAAKKFLFNWREANNDSVDELFCFTKKVLSIPMAHELVSRYTILVDDKKDQKFIMVLRPYQIHAIKRIIEQASKHEGGFIWHATGSGKTITSFVATKILAQTATGVARTVMIVDRKDLDSQTKKEFNKFASEYNTGLSVGDTVDNTLIVGTGNRRELSRSLLSKKNLGTIIITTIQKLSLAVKEAKGLEKNKFEKLKSEHIVFIVDECHRAISDREMKEIKKLFPNSTWLGLTGTPIFEENQKAEVGKYARTTYEQYGDLLHAYTTKNAMDDKSVLDFQVEYHSLLNEDEERELYLCKIIEKFPKHDAEKKLYSMEEVEKETLFETSDYENSNYITAMLHKIFKHNNIMAKFKVIDGMPTMSGILTTHSIAQAKRIYHKLIELKNADELIIGRPPIERNQLRDPDFPRVAITYSVSDNQDEKNEADAEIQQIMDDYNAQYGTSYSDVDRYNKNINNRLARKEAQYQKDGKWIDLVIVVDRLLTGFDAPTIQTLYVDRELKWHGLLQAFSRTNRLYPGKDIGMIVTFRKPKTMALNVQNTIRLFSNEERDWQNLVPKQYAEVYQNFVFANNNFEKSLNELEQDPNNITKKMQSVKAYQALTKQSEAIKSYEEFEEDISKLEYCIDSIINEVGYIETLKAEIKEFIKENNPDDTDLDDALEIEFSHSQRATLEEKVDSYYINQLLRDIRNKESKQKFDEIIKDRPDIVKATYDEALDDISIVEEQEIIYTVDKHFKETIDEIIDKTATSLGVVKTDLLTSFEEYSGEKTDIPHINEIICNSTLTKEEFEHTFNEKYRNRRLVIENYWRNIIEDKLLPLREEINSHI